MSSNPRSFHLNEMSWVEVRAHLERDRRLLLPVGSCDQYGPHLPIGATTIIAERLADALSAEFGVLRAPTLAYGVNRPAEDTFTGSASLYAKTLHRLLNELLLDWEDHGVSEFILITAHTYAPHVEAIATVAVDESRVRVIDVLGIDLSGQLGGVHPPEHGGQVETSLLLHLCPERVDMEAIVARPDGPVEPVSPKRLKRIPKGSLGAIGHPQAASAELGAALYAFILNRIREKVFGAPSA